RKPGNPAEVRRAWYPDPDAVQERQRRSDQGRRTVQVAAGCVPRQQHLSRVALEKPRHIAGFFVFGARRCFFTVLNSASLHLLCSSLHAVADSFLYEFVRDPVAFSAARPLKLTAFFSSR